MKHLRAIALLVLLSIAVSGCAGVTFSQVLKASTMGAVVGCRLLLATEIGAAEEADAEPPVEDAGTSGGEVDGE